MAVEFVYSLSWFAAQSFCISYVPTKDAGRGVIWYFSSHLVLLRWWLHRSLHKLSSDGWGFVCFFVLFFVLFFPALFIFNGNRDVYYVKGMLLHTVTYNILSKRFRITWSETKRKLRRSLARINIQYDYKQIKFTKASSFQTPSTRENGFHDILYLCNGKAY